MAVRKNGDRWIVEFMFRGIRHFHRLPKGRTKADAQALESKLRSQIFDAVDLGKLPDPLLEKLIDEWLETIAGRKSYLQTRGHARRVCADCKGVPLSQQHVVGERIRNLVHLRPGTRNRRLCVLKAVAKYAYQKGYCKENLSAKIQLLPEKSYTRRQIDMGAIPALMDAATTPRARALIAFGAYTGMRLGEILKLAPEDVVGGFIRVRDSKTGEDRQVPIAPALKPHLGALPFKGNWRNVYRGWLSARKRAKLTLRYHDLRHMAATAMAEAGHHPIIIADVLGHKSLQTTRKYTHPSLEAKAKALGAITAGLQQGRKKKARK
jgi:integrase